jgi:predicted AAA+ superfamily ATPase
VKAPEKYISFLCLNLTGITNREDILAEIAHVNINMDGRSIPFVSSDQIQIALDRASQGRGLFITGPRGSGKSRLLFEASKKTDEMLVLGEKKILEQIKSDVENAGGKASDITDDSTLANAKKRRRIPTFCSGTTSLMD